MSKRGSNKFIIDVNRRRQGHPNIGSAVKIRYLQTGFRHTVRDQLRVVTEPDKHSRIECQPCRLKIVGKADNICPGREGRNSIQMQQT